MVKVASTAQGTLRDRVGILGKVEELLQPPEGDVGLGDASHDVREGPDGELETGEHREYSEGLGGREEVTRGPKLR